MGNAHNRIKIGAKLSRVAGDLEKQQSHSDQQKTACAGLFYNQKLKIKNQKSSGTLEETLIHMEDPPKWLFLLEEGRFRRSKFSVSVRFYVDRVYEVFEY